MADNTKNYIEGSSFHNNTGLEGGCIMATCEDLK